MVFYYLYISCEGGYQPFFIFYIQLRDKELSEANVNAAKEIIKVVATVSELKM